MYDLNAEIIKSVEAATRSGTRPSGWTVKTAVFLAHAINGDSSRWFTVDEIREVLSARYGAQISDEAVGKILEDALRTNHLGMSGGKYRAL